MSADPIEVSSNISNEPRGRLLLVEGDDDLRRVLAELFEFVGHRVVSIPSVSGALEQVAESVDAVVLLCPGTPVGVTDDMAALARTVQVRVVPLVVVSLHGLEHDWARSLGTPFASNLRSIDDLLAVIEVALGSTRPVYPQVD